MKYPPYEVSMHGSRIECDEWNMRALTEWGVSYSDFKAAFEYAFEDRLDGNIYEYAHVIRDVSEDIKVVMLYRHGRGGLFFTVKRPPEICCTYFDSNYIRVHQC